MLGHGAVFFDVDGVLIDSVNAKGEAFAGVFAEYPEHRDAIIALHRANGGVDRGRKFEMIHEQILGVPLTDERAVELRARFAGDVLRRVLEAREIPGSSTALERLGDRYPLHAISAVPVEELERVLSGRGIRGRFESIHGVPPGKEVTVARLLMAHGYDAAQCVFVGDSPHDASAARENGVPFIHVRAGSAPSVPDAVATVTDLRGLESVIESVRREAGE